MSPWGVTTPPWVNRCHLWKVLWGFRTHESGHLETVNSYAFVEVVVIGVSISTDGCVALQWRHNGLDSISYITSLPIVYSIVYSDADQRKHYSSASLAFVCVCVGVTNCKMNLDGNLSAISSAQCFLTSYHCHWRNNLMLRVNGGNTCVFSLLHPMSMDSHQWFTDIILYSYNTIVAIDI